jgi:hypothetical protein
MGVNIISLREEISRQADKFIRPKMSVILNDAFIDAKEEMLQEFDDDDVTQELNAGPELDNSQFIDTKTGGNLYSFLGFDAGDEPAEELRDIIDKQTTKGRVTKTIKDDVIQYSLDVKVPSISDIESQTRTLSWTTRSWVNAIQRGIGGFPSYVFKALGFKNSRSGTALEAKNPIRDGSFEPVNYISKILNNFKNNVKGK